MCSLLQDATLHLHRRGHHATVQEDTCEPGKSPPTVTSWVLSRKATDAAMCCGFLQGYWRTRKQNDRHATPASASAVELMGNFVSCFPPD